MPGERTSERVGQGVSREVSRAMCGSHHCSPVMQRRQREGRSLQHHRRGSMRAGAKMSPMRGRVAIDLHRQETRQRINRSERRKRGRCHDVITSRTFGNRDKTTLCGRIWKSGKSANDVERVDVSARGAFSPFEAVHPRRKRRF
jgi:hypothetical protein